ncbi:hypothetical protein [Microbulbifer variabilis]|uniref:hypothetical protein n=1 Tax=Microbulbifer variabilis TaxID=266805 RepID=UPI001CFF3C80|nr:hypothetical protein [Microbulbifer variabilis]
MNSITATTAADLTVTDTQPIDAMAEFFVHLGELANVNTNQILIVSGQLLPEVMEQSVQRAVRQIPLLRTRPKGTHLRGVDTTKNQWVHYREYSGPCDFNDLDFRRLLMDFSSAHRLQWRDRPPLQVLLVNGGNGHNSCVYLSSHHGVADARSDCLLLRAIIDHYAFLSGVAGAIEPSQSLPFAPLPKIRPDWFRPLERGRRWLRALASISVDLLRSDKSLPVKLKGQRWETETSDSAIGQLDFFQSLIPKGLEARLASTAKSNGVTINTLLSTALAQLVEKTGNYRSGTLRITCAVSLRRLIDKRYDHSFRNYLIPSPIRLRAGQTTRALVSSMHNAMARARSDQQVSTELARLETLMLILRLRPLHGLARRLLNQCLGTNACYSNPGRIEEDFSSFGSEKHKTQSYVGFGCLVPPYDFILYTPTVNGRMQLDLVYRRSAFRDIHEEFAAPFLDTLRSLLDELSTPPRS